MVASTPSRCGRVLLASALLLPLMGYKPVWSQRSPAQNKGGDGDSQKRQVTKEVSPEEFAKAKGRPVEDSVKLGVDDKLTVALPRLLAGYIWRWSIENGDDALVYVGDDEFYKANNLRPGQMSRVAYSFALKKPLEGKSSLVFRHINPRNKSAPKGPIYVVNLQDSRS